MCVYIMSVGRLQGLFLARGIFGDLAGTRDLPNRSTGSRSREVVRNARSFGTLWTDGGFHLATASLRHRGTEGTEKDAKPERSGSGPSNPTSRNNSAACSRSWSNASRREPANAGRLGFMRVGEKRIESAELTRAPCNSVL